MRVVYFVTKLEREIQIKKKSKRMGIYYEALIIKSIIFESSTN